MKWRCLNNIFYYCLGEPVPGVREETKLYGYEAGKRVEYISTRDTCKLDPKFCGFALTFTESLDLTPSVKR